nr:LPS biosynthesis glycosyltransferase [Chitinophagaceae bacterium]
MLFPENDIKTIAVFRALQLGDLLCSIPALQALRSAYPSAHISIIGMPWMKALPERFPSCFDEFIGFPGYPGLPEQALDTARTIDFLTEMKNRKFDLAIQMQGNGSVVNPMLELFGARYNAGYCRKEDYYPGKGFMEYPAAIPEIHRHLLLMHHLGIYYASDKLKFPVMQKDRDDLQAASLNIQSGSYICVHPGSRGGWR